MNFKARITVSIRLTLFVFVCTEALGGEVKRINLGNLTCRNVPEDPCGATDTVSRNAIDSILGQIQKENQVSGGRDRLKEVLNFLDTGKDPAKSPKPSAKKVDPRNRKFPSIATFIAALPLSLRGNSIFMGPSRSNQDGSPENPKVILKSPNSDVILSFNSHPEQHGSNEVEMMLWNAKTRKYDFASVAFAEGPDGAPIGKAGLSAVVRRNPPDCSACHGTPARAKWDPGPMWPGQIPFVGDKILGDNNLDTKQYRSIVERIEKARKDSAKGMSTGQMIKTGLSATSPLIGSVLNAFDDKKKIAPPPDFFADRMKSLVLPSLSEIDKGIASKKGTVIPNFREPNGPASFECNVMQSGGKFTTGSASRMADELSMKNWCSVADELGKDPAWPKIKYVVAGALRGCPEIGGPSAASDFLPNSMRAKAVEYIKFRNQGAGKDRQISSAPGKFLAEETAGRLDRFQKTREELQQLFMEKRGGNRGDFLAWAEIDSFNRNPNLEADSAGKIGRLRYALEPLGIEVNRWSFSIDQNNYTMGNLLGLLGEQPLLKEVTSEIPAGADACKWLGKKSRAAFADSTIAARAQQENIAVCGNPGNRDFELLGQTANRVSTSVLKPRMQDILQKCVTCHSSKKSFAGGSAEDLGAPEFKMVKQGKISVDTLEAFIKANPVSEFGNAGWAQRFWSRIGRPQDAPGAMPPPPLRALSNEDRETIRAWLGTVDPNVE